MVWDRLKRWFAPNRSVEKTGASGPSQTLEDPQVRWLEPADNPWGVPVLDVRPITLGMLSTSEDPQCARNAISFGRDDGTGFIGIQPGSSRQIRTNLRFRTDGTLADGALFIPVEMEHKWALYFHRGQIICIRSWLRSVEVVADARASGDHLEITTARGVFSDQDEAPEFTARVLDFLLRSHAMGMVYPAPLPPGIERDPRYAAIWCMANFGNRVQFATPHALAGGEPERPLRTDSLLHIAVATGDVARVDELLGAGVLIDLLARDGLAPLHWSLARDDNAMLDLLLKRGSPVDVRSEEGATPLMNAVQARALVKVASLLDHGADPNAADTRGFTSLHRAAEMGEGEIARFLLDRGATPHPEAQGHTPRSLAALRGESAIVELLDRR